MALCQDSKYSEGKRPAWIVKPVDVLIEIASGGWEEGRGKWEVELVRIGLHQTARRWSRGVFAPANHEVADPACGQWAGWPGCCACWWLAANNCTIIIIIL